MKTLIIDNFDSFTYNLFQYCAELGGQPEVHRNNAITIQQIQKKSFTHIIISPGPGTPEKPKDIGASSEIIKKLAGKVPILGVCLGHQAIAHIFGGKIVRAPLPVHGKKSIIALDTSSPIFKGMPKEIEAMRYHSLIAKKKSFPKKLKIIAETAKGGLIMGLQHKTMPLFGVQFHPESIGTATGKQILSNFLAL